jgi:hypothetical protein
MSLEELWEIKKGVMRLKKRTLPEWILKFKFQEVIDSKKYNNGFKRFGCLAVIEPSKLIDFYCGLVELEEDELARLEEVLINEESLDKGE